MAASVNPNQVPVGEHPMPARRDFRQEVTDRIVNCSRTVWLRGRNHGIRPMLRSTCRRIQRQAKHTAAATRFTSWRQASVAVTGIPRWMTYRQAVALAWQVRKGEKGTQIEFWEVKNGTRHEI